MEQTLNEIKWTLNKYNQEHLLNGYEELPENCRNYIEFIEKEIGYPITMVSNGPGRNEIIFR